MTWWFQQENEKRYKGFKRGLRASALKKKRRKDKQIFQIRKNYNLIDKK